MIQKTLLERQRTLRFREEPIYRSPLRNPRQRNPQESQVKRLNRRSAPNWIEANSIRHVLSGRIAHDPLIPGMRHGGMAELGRHNLTPFGSGWRGIVSLDPVVVEKLTGHAAVVGASVSGYDIRPFAARLRRDASSLGLPHHELERTVRDLEQAADWTDATGFDAVLINKRARPDQLREIVRHERIHGLEERYPNHPFIKKEISESPDLAASVRGSLPKEKAEMALSVYTAEDKVTQTSERLAWGRQADKTFFSRAKAAGLNLPDVAAARRTVKGVMQAGEHVHELSTYQRLASRVASAVRMSKGV